MNALEGSTVRCSTLADGTLRAVMDFEPKDAQAAFALFGSPGRGVAVAALKDARAALLAPPAPPPPTEAPKPARRPRERTAEQIAQAAERWHTKGPLERAAIELCNVSDFQEFFGVANPTQAGRCIKEMCGIETRSVLDSDPIAGSAFRDLVLEPYRNFQIARSGGTG